MASKTRETRQKEIIENEISNINSFFSSDYLYEKVKEKDSRIGRATVYRYLKFEKEKGRLFGYTCDRRMVYTKNKKSHCHFTCEKTGKVTHINIDNIDFLKNKVPGSINQFQIEIVGVCDNCTSKNTYKNS